jgi:hypothetical protein
MHIHRKIALLGLLELLLAGLPTAAQDFRPALCPNTAGAYYQPNAFPKFRGSSGQLILVDWKTGAEIRTLDEDVTYRYAYEWSPDCHYLIGIAPYRACNPGLMIWDAVTGGRKLTPDYFCGNKRIYWRDDSAAVLLSGWIAGPNGSGSSGPQLIWYPASGETVELHVTGIYPNLHQIYWDDKRGWLWGSSDYGVTAFDVHTGEQVISFINPANERYGETASYFTFSPDDTHVIVQGQSTWDRRTSPNVSVYDIASGVGVAVNVEQNGAGRVALSPDNRYLVMVYSAVRVWDLAQLPENVKDRLPVRHFGGPKAFISAIRFVDTTVLEITTDSGKTSKWDVRTGEEVR